MNNTVSYKRNKRYSSAFQIVKEQVSFETIFKHSLSEKTLKDGGAMRDRTADLLRARQALSQLSYNPLHTARMNIKVPIIELAKPNRILAS